MVHIGVEAGQEVRLCDYGSVSFNFGLGPLTSVNNAQNLCHIKSPYNLKGVRNTGKFQKG